MRSSELWNLTDVPQVHLCKSAGRRLHAHSLTLMSPAEQRADEALISCSQYAPTPKPPQLHYSHHKINHYHHIDSTSYVFGFNPCVRDRDKHRARSLLALAL